MQADDSVGVVSFGDDAVHEYHDSNAVVQITGDSERNAAKTAIDNINFAGCTYMGAGLDAAQNQIAAATNDKAIVLLSDGKDNKGCDESNSSKQWAIDVAAALPSSTDVYTCAMGPLSDQENLEDIADLTGGRYYYMPTIDDLLEIYNFIRGNVTSSALIVNASSSASFSRVSATVDCDAEQVIFACNWGNAKLRWVGREPHKDDEIQVMLRNPAGERVPAEASWVSRQEGEGYVIFTIEDPLPGQWYIEVKTNREEHTPYTVGGWLHSDTDLVWKLSADPRSDIRRLDLGLSGRDDLRVKYSATLSAPRYSLKELLKMYEADLKDIRPDRQLIDSGVDPRLAQLITYDRKLTRSGKTSLFKPMTRRLRIRDHAKGIQALNPARLTNRIGRMKATDLIKDPKVLGIGRLRPELLKQPIRPELFKLPQGFDKGQQYTKGIPVPASVAGSYTVRLQARAMDPRTGCHIHRVAAQSFVVRKDRD